ncbi:MAG: aminopeptidase [Patescibacteria group bacterium]
MDQYQPSAKVLQKYADVLVNYALNSGQGIKHNEVVLCQVPDVAKPLALALQNTILTAGGQPIIRLLPTGFSRDYFNLAKNHQLTFFPKNYLKSQADLIDHQINIIAETDPFELKNIAPQKIFLKRDSTKPYVDWLTDKEVRNKYTWTIGLWGTEAKAKLVKLSLKAYWQQIIQACFLNETDPISKWREITALQKKILAKINALKIQSIHIIGQDIDLTLTLGPDRIFSGGSGRNIPSFEVFTSPDWRGTEGWFFANQPLYRYGNLVKDIRLEFKAGQVIKAQAKIGNSLLQQMLKSPNADKLGEFSLTDKRMSRITHVMAETLFDENISGPFGNTHIAIGRAYKDCFRGDARKMTAKDWANHGFNDSPEHTDIISTSDRTVTAALAGGVTKVIYRSGKFTL